MECEIFRRGQVVGVLSIGEDGLYRVLRGRIEPSEDILRLYLRGLSFGVFVPEDGALGLRRRVSRQRLPEDPAYAVAWCEDDGRWLPAEAGFRRFTPLGQELAVRWRVDAPMAFPAAPEALRAVTVGGVCCLACALPYQ